MTQKYLSDKDVGFGSSESPATTPNTKPTYLSDADVGFEKPSYGLKDFGGDVASVVTKGVMAVPQAAVGLADIATGGRAGKALEDIGVRFKDANEIADSWKSDSLKGQMQEFQQAEGLVGKASAALRNPGLIASTVGESIPSMLAGGALARGVGMAVPSLVGRAGLTAAGEGAVMAGSQAEGIRQQTADGLLTPGQSALAAGTGVIGAGLGVLGNKAAKALGVGDIDQMIASGATQGVARQGMGVLNRAGRGALTEGVFEELPQSLTETGLQNIALDKPVTEGMDEAAVLGTLSGGVMGAGAGVISGMGRQSPVVPQPEPQPEQVTQPDAITPIDSPDAGIDTPIKPSEAMGINPNAGALSKVAAMAVDTGVTQQVQAEQIAAQVAASEEKSAGLKEKATGQAVPEENSIDPLTAQPEAPVPMEARSMDELRQALRNAQDPTIRKTVAAEIRRRRESMPDPLSQQQETTSVITPAQSFQTSSEESKAQPAAAPAVIGQPLTDTGSNMLGRGADPLQSLIESENNVRRANEGLRSTPATSTGQRIDQPSASMGTAVAGVRSGGNDTADAKPAQDGDAGSGTGSAGDGVSALTNRKYTIVAINEKTGKKTVMDLTPMSHQEAVTMKSKMNAAPSVRIQLEEIQNQPEARPPRWRQNALQAGKVARQLGLDPKGKRLAEIVAEIDAVDASPARSDSSLNRDSSWVIKNKETGEVVMETFDRRKVDALNTSKYEAVPILEHLASLNRNVQNTPQGTAGKAKAAPVEASKAARGDDAAAGGVPAKAGAADVQADGVKSDGKKSPNYIKTEGLPPTDVRIGDTVSVDGESYTVTKPLKEGKKVVGVVASRDADTDPLKGVRQVFLRGEDAIKAKIAAADLSKNQPKADTSAEPVQETAKAEQPTQAEPTQSRDALEDKVQTAPSNEASASSAARRINPVTTIDFAKPIIGPSGAQLKSYTWQWKPMEFIDSRGEERVKKISDWNASEASGDTGREVVHQFVVDDNGTDKVVSAESAMRLMGFEIGSDGKARFASLSSASKTLARLKMQQAELEQAQQQFTSDNAAVLAMPLPPMPTERDERGWWNLGDEQVRQIEPGPMTDERRRALIGSWRDKRLSERGWKSGQSTAQDMSRLLDDLSYRIKRQQTKVDRMVAESAAAPAAPTITATTKADIEAQRAAKPAQATTGKPRLGETADEVYASLKKLSGGYVTGNGIVPVTAKNPAGRLTYFVGADGKIEIQTKEGVGYRPATKEEQQEFHDDLEADQLMIRAMTRPGYGSGYKTQRVVAELHSPSGNGFKTPQAYSQQPTQAEQKAEEAPDAKTATKPTEKIEDFGEKLAGARKDYAATLKDAMSVDVAAEPLSKSWPEPDYQKLLDGGADPFMVSWVHAARDEIPTKPQTSWKLSGWVSNVKMLRDMSSRMLVGEINKADMQALLDQPKYSNLKRQLGGRAELYQAVGHGKSLKGMTFMDHHYSVYRGEKNVTKWAVEMKAKSSSFGNWPREIAVADTKDAALEQFKAKYASLETGPKSKGKASFVIYRKRGEGGAFIGKKIGREYIDLHKAEDVKSARTYLDENTDKLEKALERYKDTPFERGEENAPRVGGDHRSGAPVTPEVFAETFGFRGVQFGNYVEQGRRQSDLNEAYDALMDMAAVLGIPAKSISLNGRLGLAFGARGKGGKNAPAAHYEGDNVVINLTKGGGPGSLAHEWFHAMDNYFAKQGGDVGYMTDSASGAALREEMRKAFKSVKTAINTGALRLRSMELDKRRTKPYWSTSIEMAARSFESYIIAKLQDQNASNDYLANVVDEKVWEISEAARAEFFTGQKAVPSYPYPTVDELPVLRAAFDDFFKVVQTRETDTGNVEMFYGEKSKKTTGTPTDRAVMDMAGDQRSADEILSFIQKTSKSPFNRQIARLLIKTGANPAVSLGGEMGGGAGFKFLAKYSRKDHEVTLSEAAAGKAEQIFLHETVHAATLLALDKGGLMATQMNRLYEQVKANGAAQGQYGLKNVGEFVAEAFTNKEFQAMLKGIKVPGGTVWERFVNMVRRVLGMPDTSTNALSKALELGAEVMRENMPLRAAKSFRAEDGPAYLGAWHGSPHRFDKFSTDKMGSGEGAQAYGWGLYFTSKKEIADFYRESLNFRSFDIGEEAKTRGLDLNAAGRGEVVRQSRAGDENGSTNEQVARRIQYANAAARSIPLADLASFVGDYREKSKGQLYSVEIPEDSEMLLWDKPLSEQPAKVREALEAEGIDTKPGPKKFSIVEVDGKYRIKVERTGNLLSGVFGTQRRAENFLWDDLKFVSNDKPALNLYERLSTENGGEKEASQYLLSIGIKGIKYLDGTSRTAGDGSYNYVVFSGDDVSITDTAYMGTKDQTETEAFRKWFVNSAVVDADGKPMVVFHGTTADFNKFDPAKRGSVTGVADAKEGFFFAASGKAASEFTWKSGEMTGNVMPVYLSMQNPMRVRLPGEWAPRKYDKALADAKAAGHDGLIVEGATTLGTPGDYYIAFRPEQIKSATGNRGTFDPEDADISHFGEAAIEQIKAFDVKTAPKNTWAHYRGMALQALGRRQIVDLYAEELPMLEHYNDLVQRMDADKNEAGAEADQLVRRWANLDERAMVGVGPLKHPAGPAKYPGMELKLAELMHDATLAQIDPDKALPAGYSKTEYIRLKAKFEALSPAAKEAFRQARDMYADHYTAVQKAIKERIERSEMSPSQKKQIMAQMDEKLFKQLQGVYFPLARFGQYVIVVKDANGEVKNVTRAETVNEAEKARKELLKAFPAHMGNTVGKVLKQAEFNAGRDAVGKGFMADLMNVLDEKGVNDELRDTVAQLYLSSLPDLSWAKHGIHRKGTPGFSQDARRAFAQNMFHGARYLAKLRYSDQLQDELAKMQDHIKDYEGVDEYDSVQAQQVVDEMVKRHDSMMNPQSSPVSTALTSFGFLFHMGLSPASAMVNLTQTALVAFPQMGAKWGFGKASAALIKASDETVRAKNDLSKVLKGDELDALNKAINDGTIDVTMAHDLAGISQGEDQGVMWKIRPVMRLASGMFHHAEKFNRQATFIAAYRLAKEKNPAKPFLDLYEEAKKITYDSHFDYSACVDDSTEILTMAGWKNRADLKVGDVAIATDASGRAVQSKVLAVNVYDGDREVIEFKSANRFSMVLTPNHDCVIQSYNSRDKKWQGVRKVRADSLKQSHFILRTPLAPLEKQDGVYGQDFAALLGWIAAEGWYSKYRKTTAATDVRLGQSVTHNPEYVTEIRGILQRLGGEFKEYTYERKRDTLTTFVLRRSLGRRIQEQMPEKVLTSELVASMSTSEMKAFLMAFLKGDGTCYENGRAWAVGQKNGVNLDLLQAMATMCGMRATLSPVNSNEIGTLYVVPDDTGARSHVRPLAQTRRTEPLVWCPTTEHGTWIARRNGAVFVTGNSNRPRFMQGNWQKVIFLFKQYSTNMLYTLGRNAYLSIKSIDPKERTQARKALGGILAAHAAAAGVLGLPIVGPLLTIASFIGGDDDEPWDAEVAMQNAMAELLGPKAAEVMARGLSRLTPFDLSGRVALNKLILPDVQEGLEGKEWAESAMTAALGPVAGIGVNVARGMQKITEGDYLRGMEDMMPTALRGPLKAFRYANEGAVDKSGVVITDEVSAASVLGQASGFSPSQVRRDTERRSAIYGHDRALTERRSVLMKMFADARMNGDSETVQEIQKDIRAFNEKNPTRRITGQNLMQSIRNRRKRIDEAEQGLYLPKNRRDAMDAVNF